MKSIKKAELILEQLSNDPMYLHTLPQNDEMKELLKVVVLSYPSTLDIVPEESFSNALICAAIAGGYPLEDLDGKHLNLITSLFACLNQPTNFFDLPEEFKYPLNFAAACLGDGKLMLNYYIEDDDYKRDVNKFIALLSSLALENKSVEGITNALFNFN